ncbi:putative dynein light chain [Echinococcus granulosus]|uniref:Dynein light chain n=1 Tax=Echinococcus granulosus TaxID=6210 RepID=W6UD89_ECHGR|nr:putative dynein light chain [Echinococcus granulosus]EUB58943.1 putative dynein light chain [Echinococcus granulosus]
MYKQQEKLEVRSSKMPKDMERDALETARRALDRNSEPRAVANMIKKEFDERYTPNWHCIVGNHFGSPIYCTVVSQIYASSSQGDRELVSQKQKLPFPHYQMKSDPTYFGKSAHHIIFESHIPSKVRLLCLTQD